MKSSLADPCVHAKLLQSCPALGNPMDSSLPRLSVREILQAGILLGCHSHFPHLLPKARIIFSLLVVVATKTSQNSVAGASLVAQW